MLYECLLGRKIFSGGDMHQLMNRIRAGRVPDFAQACPEHDALLGDFFRSALHKTITRRPASAREFRERLAAAAPALLAPELNPPGDFRVYLFKLDGRGDLTLGSSL